MTDIDERSDDLAGRSDVHQKIFRLIDIASMRGLEIGPLHNPRLPPEHPNALFLDHASTQELREKYAGNALVREHMDEIVDVDFVWRPGERLSDTVGNAAPFDFVLASHLVEHIPNPIGWLQQVGEILRPEGVLSLIIPDKRYCFDARRQTTTLAQWIDAYLRDLEQPSYLHVFDHESNFISSPDAAAFWDGADPHLLSRGDVPDADVFALDRCRWMMNSVEFVDVHCSTFTPETFLDLCERTATLELMPFRLGSFFPTVRNSFEFYVSLVRLPTNGTGSFDFATASRSFRIGESAGRLPRDADTAAGIVGDDSFELSVKERRLLELKRSAMHLLRSVSSRLRSGRALLVSPGARRSGVGE